ncbi:MAG: site-specific integrase, partial [Clostridia bacterium]|nr:site-specific integrase [Clostridia bacterium]
LSVNKTCRDSWGGGYCKMIGTPKTPRAYRLIPIQKQMLPYLRRMKRKSSSSYVVSGDGKEVSVRSYQRTFSRILARFCIPHRGFHALRHTFATRAIENNIDIKTLAEVMGHKSPAVTLAIYAHSLAPHKKMMMNRLGKLLHGSFLEEEEE